MGDEIFNNTDNIGLSDEANKALNISERERLNKINLTPPPGHLPTKGGLGRGNLPTEKTLKELLEDLTRDTE